MAPLNNYPILVVDDEEGPREALRMILKEDHPVLFAKDAQECLDLLRKEKVGCVLLDIRLPGMDGIELLQKIKETRPEIPIIIVSAVATHKVVIDALKLGAIDFVAKPLDVIQVRDTVRKAILQAECDKAVGSPSSKKVVPTVEEVLESTYLNVIKTLCKILVKKDPYTRQHSQEVTRFALMMGRALGLSKEELLVLEQAALLHDIGKVGIPDHVLQKPGPLSAGEWELMKQHSDIGQEILEHIQVLHLEQNMVRHHHERYDGKGYPAGLRGEEIPLYARILTIADSFHAMVSDRPYRKALSFDVAVEELKKNRGTQFDPTLVEIFLKALEEEGLYKRGRDQKKRRHKGGEKWKTPHDDLKF